MALSWVDKTGLFSAIMMPLWNIPLIVKIIKRRSSEDISLAWALGVWVCIILMFPSGLRSEDVVWRTFNIINTVLFSAVVIVTVRFRKGACGQPRKDKGGISPCQKK